MWNIGHDNFENREKKEDVVPKNGRKRGDGKGEERKKEGGNKEKKEEKRKVKQKKKEERKT